MKTKILIALLTIVSLAACGGDDDGQEPVFSSDNELTQTTWNCVRKDYKDGGKVSESHYIMQFVSEEDVVMYLVNENDDAYGKEEDFYSLDNKYLVFYQSRWRGNWTLIKKSSKRIVLRRYEQTEQELIMTRRY